MKQAELHKHREIQFAKFPPGQVPEAADTLQSIEDVAACPVLEKLAVGVDYDLTQHTLQELETHLENQGYHLDNALMNKLVRALVHYSEDVQLHNLGAPEKRLKRSATEAYVRAWEQHPHGDHDETPPEWREYK